MSETDQRPADLADPSATDPGPGRHPGSGVAVRRAEAPVAPMDGGSGATRMTSEAVADTRPWNAVEFVA
ncbi:hypothetical protein FXF50_03200 [Micromonospora sp. AP08]|uniref:hypothetical protein n=1 Tax=Micromonospora sp. AP08 TaxID=2604467 RepID=UPI0011D9519B|nr:hypothetical protein [Micromonospora sp. AP08]TYB40719.1 hypothetical protein FXF50_03200 [Micromonospora sp. AP08]